MSRLWMAAVLGLGGLVALGPVAAHADCLDPLGDIDGQSGTTVVDVQCSILASLYALSGEIGDPPDCLPSDLDTADPNCDESFDVSDILLIIQYVLGNPLSDAIDGNGDNCPDACQESCGDGSCDAGLGENCGNCAADCGACTGDCCGPGASPGCETAACTDCVCANDPTCCDVAWDLECAGSAVTICSGACTDCAAPEDTCIDAANCSLGCAGDLVCLAACATAADPASGALANDVVSCALASGCSTDSPLPELVGCITEFCLPEFQTCFLDSFPCGDGVCGDGENCSTCPVDCGFCTGDCCLPGASPGCNDSLCTDCVCGNDSTCCDVAWDLECAGSAVTICAPACSECEAPGGSCIDAANCSLLCGGDLLCLANCAAAAAPDSGVLANDVVSCALASGCSTDSPLPELVGCITEFCLPEFGACFVDSFPCGDGVCGDGEDCATCPGDCGTCEGSCCLPGEQAGCDDGACQNCVCANDSFCCSTAWDVTCAGQAVTLCSPVCAECAAPTGSCIDAANCSLGCGGDLVCLATCAASAGDDSGALANDVVGCALASGCSTDAPLPELVACITEFCLPQFTDCFGDSFGCGNGECGPGESCSNCPADCGACSGDCCAPGASPGCDDSTCTDCVCGNDSFCCTTGWDITCAGQAVTLCAPACAECAAPENTCIDAANCSLLCGGDLVCLANCAAAADPASGALANDVVGCALAAGCSTDSPLPELVSCITEFCIEEFQTCFLDSFPCGDGVCGDSESCSTCPLDCGFCVGDCCLPGPTPGCNDATCTDCVCANDSFCCSTAWDLECAGSAVTICGAACAECAAPEGTCIDAANCSLLCGGDLLCLANCAGAAAPDSGILANDVVSCALAAGCSTDSPLPELVGCITEFCLPEFGVCFADSFPCGDGVCGDDEDCTTCPLDCGECEGDCCAPGATPGCDDGLCQGCVCANDSFCCTTAWDITCAGQAVTLCSPVCADCAAPSGTCIDAANCSLLCGGDLVCLAGCAAAAGGDSGTLANDVVGCALASGCSTDAPLPELVGCITEFCLPEFQDCFLDSFPPPPTP